MDGDDNSKHDAQHSAGFTLDGRPVDDQLPDGWGKPAASRVGRIGERSSSAAPSSSASGSRGTPGPPGDSKDPAEFYAGGGKSGLAVENPDQPGEAASSSTRGTVTDILRQAASSGPPSTDAPKPDAWSTLGHTLGSDESESVSVNVPEQAEPPNEDTQRRTLTFWHDGFSIEDGPLHGYDEPGNKELLDAIHAGRAPISLFNVHFGQPLELVVQNRTNEDYVAPPKVLKPFAGGGNRLGSVTPTISGANSPARSAAASPAPAQSPGSGTAVEPIALDASKPAVNVQVRLGDGSRHVVRVNLSHTVGDIRAYINRLHPDAREYILQTTFPVKELGDSETIEDAKLANAVVVQRFK